MALTQTNATLHAAQTGALGTDEVQGFKLGGDVKAFLDALGVVATIGRGVSDTDITYLALKQEDGTVCYVYPNAAGNGILVSTTQP